jgi:hypothetical protein
LTARWPGSSRSGLTQGIYDQLITHKMLSRDMRPIRTAIDTLLKFEQQANILPTIPPFETLLDESHLDQSQR